PGDQRAPCAAGASLPLDGERGEGARRHVGRRRARRAARRPRSRLSAGAAAHRRTAAHTPRCAMIPLAVLTGYLGSGKTTLLARLLKSPRFARTAVIINEFGEVALDHDLIETSQESFVELASGCLC